MFIKKYFFVLLVFSSLTLVSQESFYSSLTISENLKKNANAVVRLNDVDISMESANEMIIKTRRVITVLNKEGNKLIDAYQYYDNNVKIKTLEVHIYDNFSNEIEKIKEKDFKDVSAVDGGTLYSDSRVKYLEYTPIKYPYTVEFISETIAGNTAFIPSFTPVSDYFLSAEWSSFTLHYPEDIVIRKKEKNIEGFEVETENTTGKIAYVIKNIEAYKPEDYSPSLVKVSPKVLVSANKFALEGVAAQVENWNEFGLWMYHDLIKNTHDLSEATINLVKDLVKDETNDIDKAKIIYQYVQDKVRYISVQVGIGGWKPFNASQVDQLGYGDCKGLTNYTMSLLNAVGIHSNYTVLYAGDSQRSIENDFAAMQGNHVILNIPQEHQDDIWLECTSQKLPFGFIGDFTDDRDVLVITPEGGEIKHTKKYNVEENTQFIKGNYTLLNTGEIHVSASVTSKGIQYDNKYWLENETERDLDTHYKKRWNYINNLTLKSIDIVNDKDSIQFKENINFQAANYSKIIANRMLIAINVLNKNTHIPDRYRDRKMPLSIQRGFKDIDEVEIHLPKEYSIEALPKNTVIENKFGKYKSEIVIKDKHTLLYKRMFVVNDGEFPKEDYSKFRDFYKEVSRQDNAKIALIKN